MTGTVYFSFTPQADITLQELAGICQNLANFRLIHATDEGWDSIPESHKRHFTIAWREQEPEPKRSWWRRLLRMAA